MSDNNIITLTIDQHIVKVPQNTTLLEAAKLVGIDIPTLCHMKLHDMGIENKPAGCRICVVEVKGRRNLAPACVTVATDGMKIQTNSMRVLNARQTVLELILSDHPSDCLICAKSGNCDLQSMAHRF
jgi:NADP-reducing hydrogenase subunit HndD